MKYLYTLRSSVLRLGFASIHFCFETAQARQTLFESDYTVMCCVRQVDAVFPATHKVYAVVGKPVHQILVIGSRRQVFVNSCA